MENLQQLPKSFTRQTPFSWRVFKNTTAVWVMGLVTALVSGVALVMIARLIERAWPILSTVPLHDLLFSEVWNPSRGAFGLWPFITGSLFVTAVALALSIPFSLLTAIYLAEYSQFNGLIKPVIDLLASIPSVVYGLWGVLFVVPTVRDHLAPWMETHLGVANTNPSGYSLFAGGLVLAVMTCPIIIAVTIEVLATVPQGLREASLALGATDWETTKLVVLRKTWPGILAAIVLGFSRAFGETLAVVMVIGNVPHVPKSLLDPAYPLPALLANNYGEMMSIPRYEAALMTAALILLSVVLLFNIAARLILVRFVKGETV